MHNTSQHARIVALADVEWQKTQRGTSTAPAWMVRLSPPIPGTWPVTPETTISWYLYAAALDPQLADGERVSRPWGRVDYLLRTPQQLQFIALPGGLAALGTQGVRPLKPAEQDLLKPDVRDRLDADLRLLANGAAADSEVGTSVLQRYRLLFRLEGVISHAYLKHHRALAHALAASPTPL